MNRRGSNFVEKVLFLMNSFHILDEPVDLYETVLLKILNLKISSSTERPLDQKNARKLNNDVPINRKKLAYRLGQMRLPSPHTGEDVSNGTFEDIENL